MSQVEIIRKYYELYKKNNQHPSPEEIDPDSEEIMRSKAEKMVNEGDDSIKGFPIKKIAVIQYVKK